MRRGILLVALMMASPAWGALDGDRTDALLKDCESWVRISTGGGSAKADYFGGGLCLAYLDGIADMHSLYTLKNIKLWCSPNAASRQQMLLVFIKWAKEHPESHHKPRLIGLLSALKEAWPCKQ